MPKHRLILMLLYKLRTEKVMLITLTMDPHSISALVYNSHLPPKITGTAIFTREEEGIMLGTRAM